MSETWPKQIQLTIDETRYWEGLGRQQMDFHQVIGELIDNSVSASDKTSDEELMPFTIEIIIQRIGNKVRIKVADEGLGMSQNDLTNNILSPGGRGDSKGPLNEHGFGLKNALCMLTSGNKLPFKIQSRDSTAVDEGNYYIVNGPFSFQMEVELDNPDNWNVNLTRAVSPRGTRIYAETTFEFLNTLYKRARTLDSIIERLGEHLGVMYRGYLSIPLNKIWLRWQDLGNDIENPNNAAPWREEKVIKIEIPYDFNGFQEREIPIDIDGVTSIVKYREGLLDRGAVEDASNGWVYPLKIYYRGNIHTQGIDIMVRERIVKTGQLTEIWTDRERHNTQNYFIGEIELDEQFRTVNNKTAIDPHNLYWKELMNQFNQQSSGYNPTRRTGRQPEKDIKDKLKVILNAAPDSEAHLEYPIWSGSGLSIDIYHKFLNGTLDIYEVKTDTAEPIDVYQVLMYWDGIVKDENKSPRLGRLVAKNAPESVINMIDDLNSRQDSLGNNYKIEFKTIESFGIT